MPFGVGLPAKEKGDKDGAAFASVVGTGKLCSPLTDSDAAGLERVPQGRSTALLVAFRHQESGGRFRVGRRSSLQL
jgi:hypothetical protein